MDRGSQSVGIFTTMLVLVAGCSPSNAERLPGTWEGTDAIGQPVVLTFGPADSVRLRVGTDVNEDTFTVEWSRSPAHLDIDWGKRGKVATVVVVMGETLRMENNDPGKRRPESLTDRAPSLARRN
jgi:hypothetical protein